MPFSVTRYLSLALHVRCGAPWRSLGQGYVTGLASGGAQMQLRPEIELDASNTVTLDFRTAQSSARPSVVMAPRLPAEPARMSICQ